jgi:acyl-CoA thioesterase-1
MRSHRYRWSSAAAICVGWFAAFGCGSGGPAAAPPPASTVQSTRGSAEATESGPHSRDRAATRPRVVALGDSLTAGLGLSPQEAYPALLQQRIDAAGLSYEVINAGVSGDTSAGGLRRLDWALEGDVRVLIVALGGNDGLRGLPVEELHDNLARIIERGRARRAEVILAGMEAPPNFGRSYIVSFHQVYPSLAEEYHVRLVPFLLNGVAGIESLNQRDGIHPTREGARIVADNVWSVLEPILMKNAQQ